MSDTQWPRFIVFQQEKPGAPHEYDGSVHAPDAEMALLNARDVFVRRPACVSLWVVPVSAIFSKTQEEIAADVNWSNDVLEAPTEPYYVFQKPTHKSVHRFSMEVQAGSPQHALKQALASGVRAVVWWAFPKRCATASTPDDVAALFQPAETKTYRDQAVFHTEAMMQKIRAKS